MSQPIASRGSRDAIAASTNDRLHSEAEQLSPEGVKVEEHMLSGAPEQALADLATQSDARLVIVSSVGHRPGEWLLGSVLAWRVCRN